MRRRRLILLTALALLVPLPAFALDGEDQRATPVEFPVTATLEGCGVGEAQVICEIGVSFEAVEGATSYSATVTAPDGSVVDAGSISTGASVFVPYVGSGFYAVSVNAYGEHEEEGRDPDPIATGVATEVEPRDRDRDHAAAEGTGEQDPETAEQVVEGGRPGLPTGDSGASACEEPETTEEEAAAEEAPAEPDTRAETQVSVDPALEPSDASLDKDGERDSDGDGIPDCPTP